MTDGKLHKLCAFTCDPDGGNPAGVWLGEHLPDAASMQRIATEVGFSETAFVAPDVGVAREIRYFSPVAEVPFCGHATIAAGVQLGRDSGPGTYQISTQAGVVPVTVSVEGTTMQASLTSVPTRQEPISVPVLKAILLALNWHATDLDLTIKPMKAYAGAWHLVLTALTRDRLRRLDYDFDRLKALMLEEGLTTLQLLWRESNELIYSRNPFPVGGVIEDPATGAAAAALGGYLRDAGLMQAPAQITIRQGDDMGRPSVIHVSIPPSGGIVVTGSAVSYV